MLNEGNSYDLDSLNPDGIIVPDDNTEQDFDWDAYYAGELWLGKEFTMVDGNSINNFYCRDYLDGMTEKFDFTPTPLWTIYDGTCYEEACCSHRGWCVLNRETVELNFKQDP